MARRKSRTQIAAARATLKALRALPNYQSVNPAYSIEALVALEQKLTASEGERARVEQEFERARQAWVQVCEAESADGVNLYDATIVAKSQVLAQYGVDSLEVKAIGWTRKSERKRPARKAAA